MFILLLLLFIYFYSLFFFTVLFSFEHNQTFFKSNLVEETSDSDLHVCSL